MTTLRLHPLAPPSNLDASENGAGVNLLWDASVDSVDGYHVYRSTSENGEYSRLTGSPVAATSFHDPSHGSTKFYMIRAVTLANVASGSYYNLSQAVYIPNPKASVPDTRAPTAPTKLEVSSYQPTSVDLNWAAATDNIGVVSYEVFRDRAVKSE